ncbi:flagellar hook capping protein [Demequina sp. TTPB684]|uniref:flagellar hook assembly protein FlgD n=1 Tax=unclassified Demequina TaxID=2620311 RepID=UPI001CF37440|nr:MULTISPECIES: flagellar hook capping FlgD N-terminal domain-containing protein [unclassified Demequina]MCB2411367.1 flagellar hook capping protein [Demequina sp. TTPB684]UPU87890.1 flagellar hook capping protein [Demequina sp. TMPB413]
MSVAPVSAAGINTGTAPTTPPKQTLDSEVFMALLVAQLRNQDPSSPMDTNEMMSQQTQLASLEQLTGITNTSQEQFALTMRMAAMGMVGREVSFTDADGTVITGSATGASFADAVPSLTVGDATVSLERILSINPAGA